MAPLNEENDEEDDSTLFDVKYRLVCCVFISFGSLKQRQVHYVTFIIFQAEPEEKLLFFNFYLSHKQRRKKTREPHVLRMFYVYQRRENVDVDEMLTMRSHEY